MVAGRVANSFENLATSKSSRLMVSDTTELGLVSWPERLNDFVAMLAHIERASDLLLMENSRVSCLTNSYPLPCWVTPLSMVLPDSEDKGTPSQKTPMRFEHLGSFTKAARTIASSLLDLACCAWFKDAQVISFGHLAA